jgi:hypothetical protein
MFEHSDRDERTCRPRSRLHRARKRAQVTAHVGRDLDEKEPELQEVSRTLLALLLLLTASRALADPIAPVGGFKLSSPPFLIPGDALGYQRDLRATMLR